jgi:histone acetyltransferase (RNA polymerase elongator complex component)
VRRYWSANTFFDARPKRPRLGLEAEQAANERARVRIIGLTLETRPDAITVDEVLRLRRFGCTRVQLGVQHTDEALLRRINRGCTTADVRRAVRLLKDACFKIDFHLMPDLPGACVRVCAGVCTGMCAKA